MTAELMNQSATASDAVHFGDGSCWAATLRPGRSVVPEAGTISFFFLFFFFENRKERKPAAAERGKNPFLGCKISISKSASWLICEWAPLLAQHARHHHIKHLKCASNYERLLRTHTCSRHTKPLSTARKLLFLNFNSRPVSLLSRPPSPSATKPSLGLEMQPVLWFYPLFSPLQEYFVSCHFQLRCSHDIIAWN